MFVSFLLMELIEARTENNDNQLLFFIVPSMMPVLPQEVKKEGEAVIGRGLAVLHLNCWWTTPTTTLMKVREEDVKDQGLDPGPDPVKVSSQDPSLFLLCHFYSHFYIFPFLFLYIRVPTFQFQIFYSLQIR